MQFPFSYQIEVGGVAVATVNGVALIGVEDNGDDWRLAGVMCDRLDAPGPRGGSRVFMPKTHWLYARIASALINQSRNEIDTAWLAWNASNIGQAASA